MITYLNSQVSGFELYIDRYIGKDNQLSFVSCFGSIDKVKAAISSYAIRHSWLINDISYERPKENITFSTQKITSNAAHGIIYIPSLYNFTDNAISVVMGSSKEEINMRIFERLKYRTAVPLMDSWCDIIIADLVSKVELATFGIRLAYEVELPIDEVLEDYVMKNLTRLERWKI